VSKIVFRLKQTGRRVTSSRSPRFARRPRNRDLERIVSSYFARHSEAPGEPVDVLLFLSLFRSFPLVASPGRKSDSRSARDKITGDAAAWRVRHTPYILRVNRTTKSREIKVIDNTWELVNWRISISSNA